MKYSFAHLFILAAPVVSQATGQYQSSSVMLEPASYVYRPDSSSVLGNPMNSSTVSSWSFNSVPPVTVSQATKGLVLSCSYSVLPVETWICFLSSKIIISSILLTSYMPGFLDDAGLAGPTIAQNCCYSSSNESMPKTWPTGEKINRGDHGNTARG